MNCGDILGLQQFNAKPFGLGPQPLSKVKAIDTVGKTGQIVQLFGGRGLTAKGGALDDKDVDAFAGQVQRRGEAGRSATDNDHRVVLAAGCRFQTQFCCQLGVARLYQLGAVREDNGGYDPFAVVQLEDAALGLCVLFDIHPGIWNLVFAEKLFAAAAVRAPKGAVDDDVGRWIWHGIPSSRHLPVLFVNCEPVRAFVPLPAGASELAEAEVTVRTATVRIVAARPRRGQSKRSSAIAMPHSPATE